MPQRVVVAPDQIQPPQVLLTLKQQHYLSRVLRLKSGDRVIVMDGQTRAWLVSLTVSAIEGVVAHILEPVTMQTELPIDITLVIALPKGNALDDVVRQATELGVSCIAPVTSDRTLLNPSSQKLDRWRRIAQEATEQCERQLVPTLLDPVPFSTHLAQLASVQLTPAQLAPVQSCQHYLCVTRYAAPHLLKLLTSHSASTPLTLAIGPEGGWTAAEIEQAIAAGYQPVSLGSRILRAVTAPIFALSLIAAVYERG